MSRNCFAPGCKSGYSSDVKRNKALGKKNPSLFSAPKEVEVLKKWQRIIPRKDKVFNSPYKLCELHFEEDCIIRVFETKLFDGSVFRYERERPVLKPGSIPTKFPNLPKYFSERSKKIVLASQKERKCNLDNSKRQDYTRKCNLDDSERRDYTRKCNFDDSERRDYTRKCNFDDNERQDYARKCNLDDSERQECKRKSNFILEDSEIQEHKKKCNLDDTEMSDHNQMLDNDTENHLLKDIKDIEKPNKWWTICKSDNGNVLCIKLDADGHCERHVIIDKDFSVKIFFNNQKVTENGNKIQSAQNLSLLLKAIDELPT